jgi:hypothetical protein
VERARRIRIEKRLVDDHFGASRKILEKEEKTPFSKPKPVWGGLGKGKRA